MADIKVKINLNVGGSSDRIDSVEFDQKTNNVSKAQGQKTTKNDGQNLISWGNVVKDSDGNVVSKVVNGEVVTTGLLSLADGYVGGANATLGEQGGYNGFVFGVVPDSKEYSVEVTLEGSVIDSIVVYGDKNANQFPTRAYLDGDNTNYIYSDDVEWAIVFPSGSFSHTITFDMWNRANYNACLTFIGTLENYVNFGKSEIKNVESNSQKIDDPSTISYGVLSNLGNVSIYDKNGELSDYINEGILQKENTVEIYSKDNKIQSHKILDFQYDNNNFTANFSLSSKLSKLDSIKSLALPLAENVTVSETLNLLFSRGEVKNSALDSVVTTSEICESQELYEYLENIHMPYRYLEGGSLRECIDKVCAIGQINIYEKDNGNIVISNARPISNIDKNNIIKIPLNMQMGNPSISFIPKNKYSKVVVPYNNITNDYRQIGGSISFASYQTPPFKEIKDAETGNIFSQSIAWATSQFKDIHEEYNENISYLAFRVPAESNVPNVSENIIDVRFEFSLLKFVIPKDNRKSKYSEFMFKIDSDSLTAIVSGENVLPRINSSDIGESNNIFIPRSLSSIPVEEQIINNYFNVDSNGEIITSKYITPFYSLAVVNGESDLTCYLFKPEALGAIEQNSEINQDAIWHSVFRALYDYKGQISVFVKTIEETQTQVVVGEGDDSFTFPSNELLNQMVYNEDGYLYEQIANNIYEDYKDGISSANISVCCLDYFSIGGDKIVDWNIGQVLQVGDIIRVDKDNLGTSRWKYEDGSDMYFRITGRNFRKVGVPIIDLELQEVHIV